MTALKYKAFLQGILFKNRFIGSLFPGETIIYDLYDLGEKIIFLGKVKERKLNCIIGEINLKTISKLWYIIKKN